MANKTLSTQPRVHRAPSAYATFPVSVVLVGCGGNGSMMLTRLARLDYALRSMGRPGMRVKVYDPDIVSPTNVGRQCFSPSDIGQPKCEVALHRVNAFYGTRWESHARKFDRNASWMNSGDDVILVTCVDSARARRQIAEEMQGSSPLRYWLDLGNEKLDGQVILGQPANNRHNAMLENVQTASSADFVKNGTGARRTPLEKRLPTVLEMFPDMGKGRKKKDEAPTCSVADALERQSLFMNDTLTCYAAQILDDLLRIGELTYHGVFLNLATGRANPIPIPAPMADKSDES